MLAERRVHHTHDDGVVCISRVYEVCCRPLHNKWKFASQMTQSAARVNITGSLAAGSTALLPTIARVQYTKVALVLWVKVRTLRRVLPVPRSTLSHIPGGAHLGVRQIAP